MPSKPQSYLGKSAVLKGIGKLYGGLCAGCRMARLTLPMGWPAQVRGTASCGIPWFRNRLGGCPGRRCGYGRRQIARIAQPGSSAHNAACNDGRGAEPFPGTASPTRLELPISAQNALILLTGEPRGAL
jgi:hypothetical protein